MKEAKIFNVVRGSYIPIEFKATIALGMIGRDTDCDTASELSGATCARPPLCCGCASCPPTAVSGVPAGVCGVPLAAVSGALCCCVWCPPAAVSGAPLNREFNGLGKKKVY